MADDGRNSLLSLVTETSAKGQLSRGVIIADRFEVVRFVAGGGMGRVFEAVGPGGERVAIKTVAVNDEESRARFEREAEAMSLLTHAGIVGVRAFGRLPDGALYLVMEFVDGAPLSRWITGATLTPPQIAFTLRQVLFALGYAHQMGVVHRDLKPDNIMVEADGRGRMIDFGVAKLIDEVGRRSLTRKGLALGTPYYMSPEQATGQPVDGRADQYAAGIILFQALTGRVPFLGDDTVTVLRGHAVELPPTLASVTGRVFAPALEAVVARALAKRPDDRYPDMRTLALALDAAAQAG